MRMRQIKKSLSFFLCMMLIVAMALITNGCGDNKETQKEPAETPKTEQSGSEENNVLGEGETKFTFIVVDKDGNETEFEIHTDKTIVGEALTELNLLEGEEGPYGLYVKKVNGITADYDVDGTYWAFYINGEYAPTGVDVTEIKKGEVYSFKVE